MDTGTNSKRIVSKAVIDTAPYQTPEELLQAVAASVTGFDAAHVVFKTRGAKVGEASISELPGSPGTYAVDYTGPNGDALQCRVPLGSLLWMCESVLGTGRDVGNEPEPF